MRLTIVNQFYPPDLSPTAHLCASLAEHRAGKGDEVTVITSRSSYVGRLSDSQQTHGVRVRRVWSTQLGSRSRLHRLIDWATFYFSAFSRVVTLPKQDVIISMTTPPYIAWAGVAHKLLHPGARLILWNMDSYPEAVERTGMLKGGSLLSRFLRAMNRGIFRRLDHVVCLDPAMAELLAQYSPRNGKLPMSIIPNWERLSLFPKDGIFGSSSIPGDVIPSVARDLAGPDEKPDPSQARDDDSRSDSQSSDFTILYLGNAGYGHDFQTMLDAAEQLRNDPVTFLFVGGGAKRPWIEEQARQHGLTNIVLRDYVAKDQTPHVMRSADCALITLEDPMLGVMSPSKLHANLAMGLPVIYVGPRGSNVDEAIKRFGCGISVRVGEANRIAEFVRGLLKDPEDRAALRARARRAFDEAYCDRRTLPQFDSIIDLPRVGVEPTTSGF